MTWGEVLAFTALAMWLTPPPWRFRCSALLLILVVGLGG
jgi:hypothetical protein